MSQDSAAKIRVLDAAEKLFDREGYNAVTMRDIADSVGIRQASLYYHAPLGKEQLFVETMKRSLVRYRTELEIVLNHAEPTIHAQLTASAYWLLQHSTFNLGRVFVSDIPAISEENAQYLIQTAHQSLFSPVTTIFQNAMERGEIRQIDSQQTARMFLSLMDGIGLYIQNETTAVTPESIADIVVDIMLNGLYA